MADRIHSSETINLDGTNAYEMNLPPMDDLYENNSFGSNYNQNYVVYIFDLRNVNRDIYLTQNESDTLGIKIPKNCYYTSGPWRRAGGPPKFLYSAAAVNGVKYTVLKCSGGICGFRYEKNL